MRIAFVTVFLALGGCLTFGEDVATNTQFDAPPDGGSQIHTPSQECHPNATGGDTCGYNCRLGASAAWFCASTPALQCTQTPDGNWSCP